MRFIFFPQYLLSKAKFTSSVCLGAARYATCMDNYDLSGCHREYFASNIASIDIWDIFL